jgi:hypothetical protein
MAEPHLRKTIITIPNNFKVIEKDICIMLGKNEEAIRHYISRYIYTSSITPEIDKQINEIFKQIRKDLLS